MPVSAPDGSVGAAKVVCGASDADASRESSKENPAGSTEDLEEEEDARLMDIEVAISHAGGPLDIFDDSVFSIDLDQT